MKPDIKNPEPIDDEPSGLPESVTVNSPNGTIYEGFPLDPDGKGVGRIYTDNGSLGFDCSNGTKREFGRHTIIHDGCVMMDSDGNIVPDHSSDDKEEGFYVSYNSALKIGAFVVTMLAIPGMAIWGSKNNEPPTPEVTTDQIGSTAMPFTGRNISLAQESDIQMPATIRYCSQNEAQVIDQARFWAHSHISQIADGMATWREEISSESRPLTIYEQGIYPADKIWAIPSILVQGLSHSIVYCADAEPDSIVQGFAFSLEPHSMAIVSPLDKSKCELVNTYVHEGLHLGDNLKKHPLSPFSDTNGNALDITNDWIYYTGDFAEFLCLNDQSQN